jgi:hypothetical protein
VARRKRGNDGGGGGLGIILIIIFAAFSFIVSAITTVIIFVVPSILLLCLLPYLFVESKPPALPDLGEFDPQDTWDQIERARVQIIRLENSARKAFREGQQCEIEFRNRGEDEPWRFREHSKFGKALNRRLDSFDSELATLEARIAGLKQPVFDELPDWKSKFDSWRFHASVKYALFSAIFSYVLAFVAILMLGLGGKYSLSKHVLINALPSNLYEPAFGASLVSILVATSSFFIRKEGLLDRVDTVFANEHSMLCEKWEPNTPELTLLEPELDDGVDDDDSEDVEFEDEGQASRRNSHLRWFEVLDVPESSTLQEIKAAWHTHVKQYHPDLVANLGPELRELAEAKTKALNAAYQEGLSRAKN